MLAEAKFCRSCWFWFLLPGAGLCGIVRLSVKTDGVRLCQSPSSSRFCLDVPGGVWPNLASPPRVQALLL